MCTYNPGFVYGNDTTGEKFGPWGTTSTPEWISALVKSVLSEEDVPGLETTRSIPTNGI